MHTEFRVFIMFDQGIRMQGLNQGVRSIHVVDQAVVKQHDKPFTQNFRGGGLSDDAGCQVG